MKKNADDKENKRSPISKLFLLVLKTLFPPLAELNKGLRVCYHMTDDDYFKMQIRRNTIFRFISYLPVVLAYYILYKAIINIDIFKPQFDQLVKGMRFKNINTLIERIPQDFYYYCSYTISIFIILFLVSAIIVIFIRNTHPLIRENKKAKKIFTSKGVLKDKDSLFVHTPRGVLLEYEGDIDSILKNNELWKILDRNPKEAKRDSDNKNLYFIGYGFKLKNSYVFEFQDR